MHQDCAQACCSIDFEQYILRNDALGRHFLQLFTDKAKQRIRVRLICDMLGSLGLYFSRRIAALKAHGVHVRFFNPIYLNPIYWHILPRNHAKTMVIDGQVAYTGGVCFDERMRGWRDTHIRITGDTVEEIQQSFEIIWRHQTRRPSNETPRAERPFSYLTSNPRLPSNPIYRQLLRQIEQARHYVFLTTPYFVPSRKLLRRVCAAAGRGIDVRLLVSAASDVPFADLVSQSYFGRLLKAGVRIFLYEPSVMHAKSAVVDGRWATVGSMNLDHLSIFSNFESNLEIRNPRAIRDLHDRFIEDLQASREVTEADWQRRSYWKILAGRLGRIARIIL